jgi:hypothetical protein
MYRKDVDFQEIEDITILPNQYHEIKKDYLCKKENKYSLFRKYCNKYDIEKDVFLEILSLIRLETGAPSSKGRKKMKRENNPYSFNDKHPNSYN